MTNNPPYTILFICSQSQWLVTCSIGGQLLGVQGRFLVYHALCDFSAHLRGVADVKTGYPLVSDMDLGEYWAVFICWSVVAACGMVANPNEKHRQTRLRHKQYTLPQSYWRYAKKWELAGYPAFLAVVVIFFLMVIKPM